MKEMPLPARTLSIVRRKSSETTRLLTVARELPTSSKFCCNKLPGEDNQGATFVAIAPYYAHAITKTDALTCDTCHGTQTAMDLAAGTTVDVVAWNAAEGLPSLGGLKVL